MQMFGRLISSHESDGCWNRILKYYRIFSNYVFFMRENNLVWVCLIFTGSINSLTSHWISWDFYLNGITWFSTQLGLYSVECPGKIGGKRSPGTVISTVFIDLIEEIKAWNLWASGAGIWHGENKESCICDFCGGLPNSVVGKSVKNSSAT